VDGTPAHWTMLWILSALTVILVMLGISVGRANRALEQEIAREAEARKRPTNSGDANSVDHASLASQAQPDRRSAQREAFLDLSGEAGEVHVTVRLPWREVRRLGLLEDQHGSSSRSRRQTRVS
jgi:hypothetical protein